jgi:hypothetical protein
MTDRDAFERAFVATTYLVGRREGVLRGLGEVTGPSARELAERLSSAAHTDRARALADELVPLVAALDARRLGDSRSR